MPERLFHDNIIKCRFGIHKRMRIDFAIIAIVLEIKKNRGKAARDIFSFKRSLFFVSSLGQD